MKVYCNKVLLFVTILVRCTQKSLSYSTTTTTDNFFMRKKLCALAFIRNKLSPSVFKSSADTLPHWFIFTTNSTRFHHPFVQKQAAYTEVKITIVKSFKSLVYELWTNGTKHKMLLNSNIDFITVERQKYCDKPL